jgi:hypothetical protein
MQGRDSHHNSDNPTTTPGEPGATQTRGHTQGDGTTQRTPRDGHQNPPKGTQGGGEDQGTNLCTPLEQVGMETGHHDPHQRTTRSSPPPTQTQGASGGGTSSAQRTGSESPRTQTVPKPSPSTSPQECGTPRSGTPSGLASDPRNQTKPTRRATTPAISPALLSSLEGLRQQAGDRAERVPSERQLDPTQGGSQGDETPPGARWVPQPVGEQPPSPGDRHVAEILERVTTARSVLWEKQLEEADGHMPAEWRVGPWCHPCQEYHKAVSIAPSGWKNHYHTREMQCVKCGRRHVFGAHTHAMCSKCDPPRKRTNRHVQREHHIDNLHPGGGHTTTRGDATG